MKIVGVTGLGGSSIKTVEYKCQKTIYHECCRTHRLWRFDTVLGGLSELGKAIGALDWAWHPAGAWHPAEGAWHLAEIGRFVSVILRVAYSRNKLALRTKLKHLNLSYV